MLLAALSIAACLLFCAAAQQDVTRRKIPNPISATILALGAVKWACVGRLGDFGWAAAGAVFLFAATSLLFLRGLMGGGDVKLATAAGFLIGGPYVPEFVIRTSALGGVVALCVLAYSFAARLFRSAPATATDQVPLAALTVPYGVAISAAAASILYEDLFKQWTLR